MAMCMVVKQERKESSLEWMQEKSKGEQAVEAVA